MKDPRTRFDFNILRHNKDKIDFPVELVMKYYAENDPARIAVPTVFVTGAQEPKDAGFTEMLELISGEALHPFKHKGGHHFPKLEFEVSGLAELMVKTATTAFCVSG